MSNHPHGVPPVAAALKKTPTATKLLQAAALTAVLIPLGSVAVETETIRCVTVMSGGGCEAVGNYTSGQGSQYNTWEFYRNNSFDDLIYLFEVAGSPTSNFSLDVADYVTTQDDLLANGFLANFQTLKCVSTYDMGECGLFDVTATPADPPPSWELDSFYVTIRWFANDDPLSRPLEGNDFVTILQARNGTNGVFGNTLEDIWYDDHPLLYGNEGDPAIGGRGNGFSRFGVFTNPVPEPASLILLGTGLAGALCRARRRKRQP